MNPTVCPKCSYTRKPTDTAPDWQCPSCGIVYNKFQAATSQSAARAAVSRDLRERTLLPVGQRDKPGSGAFLFYGVLLLVLFIAYSQFHWVNWAKWALPVFVVSSFLFWLSAYRRKRMIEDVPTSTIAAAAQGYVELQGTAEAAPGHSLTGRLTHAPCVWYQYVIVERQKDKDGNDRYVETGRGSTAVPFILRDKTGECLVRADTAEVVCNRCQRWEEDERRFQEWSIRVGDPVHAIGHFSTGSVDAEAHLNMKVAYGLASQERDKAAFAERYDTNRDGKVDASERAAAREAARREEEHGRTNQGGVHSLSPSPDGRPFLVISAGQGRASTRYGLLALAHLGVFFLSLGALAYILL